jgi:hypothetical protein
MRSIIAVKKMDAKIGIQKIRNSIGKTWLIT